MYLGRNINHSSDGGHLIAGLTTELPHELFSSDFGSDFSTDISMYTTGRSWTGKDEISRHSDMRYFHQADSNWRGDIIDDDAVNELLFLKSIESMPYSDDETAFNRCIMREALSVDGEDELR